MVFSLKNRGRRASVVALMAVVGFCGLLQTASADLSDVVFNVEASNEAGSGVFQVTEADGVWEGDMFLWTLDAPVPITSGRNVIATLDAGTVTLFQDPQVNLSFAVQAGSVDTSFTISSALLSFDPIPNAEGRASAGISLTDFYGTGATLTGNGPNGGAYLAQYNGFVPGGSPYCELINSVTVGPMGSDTMALTVPTVGYNPLGGTANNMSSQLVFNLSANGIASGTTNFEIVPEPATGLLLLVVAGIAVTRRRR